MQVLVGVVTIALVGLGAGRPASAQPVVDPLPAPAGAGGTTKIPVSGLNGTEVLKPEATGSSSSAPTLSIDEPINPDTYTCGPGDEFELNFWGQQNFRLRIAADLEGRAFISKVGFVQVSGKSLSAVRKEMNKKIRENYPGLHFELTLTRPRTFLVHLVDNVTKPGIYVAHPLERVSSVIARAGLLTSGSKRRIAVQHKSGRTTTADLVLYELTGDKSQNPYVLDGDVIKVPFAAVVVEIRGAVRRPGHYELVESKDLAELLRLADGFTSSVARSLPIRVVRRNEEHRPVFIDLKFDGAVAPNEPLRDGDAVHVRGAQDLDRTVLLIGAVVGADPLDAATTSKRLTYIEGDTVLSLLDRAGGIKAPGDLRRSYISRPRKDGSPELIPIDLEALLTRRDFSRDKSVAMGDTIVIPPMQYSVLVEGAVARAGLYPYNPQFGIPEYIAKAGGRTRTARDLSEALLIDRSGATQPYRKGTRLSPGDSILVPERTFTRPEIVQIVLASAGLILSGVAITLAATR